VKRLDSALNTAFHCGIVLAGFALTVLASIAQNAPMELALITSGLFASGLALLLAAKTSMFRRGILLSFGSAGMSPWNRRAYRAGCALVVLGVLVTLALIRVVSWSGGAPA